MSFWDELFGTGPNASDSAMPYLNKVPGVGQQYYSPYVNQGVQASNQSNDIYQQMSADPQAFLSALQAGYKPTEGYQQRQREGLRTAEAAAAAGGNVGNENDVLARGRLVDSLMNEDMQNYINNVLGIQGTGLQGLQHQGDLGYNASSGIADYLANAYGNQGQLAYSGQAQQNSNQSNLINGLLGAAGTAAGGFFGGPGGAMLGNKLFGGNQQQQTPSTSFLGYGGGRNGY